MCSVDRSGFSSNLRIMPLSRDLADVAVIVSSHNWHGVGSLHTDSYRPLLG